MSLDRPGAGTSAVQNDLVAPGSAAVPDWPSLYQQHQPAMYRVASAGLNAAGRADVQALDIVHDAFTSIMRNPPAKVENWEAFLITVTLYKVKDLLKTAERRHTQLAPADDSGEPQTLEPPPAEDIAEFVVRRAHAAGVRARLLAILGDLTDRQRQIARLRLFDGKSVAEIAAELGTSPANVSQLLKKALCRIAEALAELDEVDLVDVERLRPARRRGGDA